MRRFLLGCAGGFVLGYAGLRAVESLRDLRTPFRTIAQDPRAYGRHRRALMVTGIARSTASLACIAFELAPRLDEPGPKRSRVRRMALQAAAMCAGSVIDLPSDYIEGHVLERRYALTQQPARAWLIDRAKTLGIGIAICVPLVELACWIIDAQPRSWPLIGTLGMVPLLILANLIAPTYIQPLFNQFEPLEGRLAERLRAMARAYGVGSAAILRVDMSKQTTKANAYVTGLFNTHRIVIGDTLLGGFSEDEIAFVVAHELGHYVSRDTWRLIAIGTACAGVSLFVARSSAERPDTPPTSTSGLARILFFLTVTMTAITPVSAAVARNRERAADRFAIAATRDPASGITAFERLRETNLAEDEQPRWMELLFATHPSLRSRIARLRDAEREFLPHVAHEAVPADAAR